MHPRRLQAKVPAEEANQHIFDAYKGGFDNAAIEGLLLGSGAGSMVGGLGWCCSAIRADNLLHLYPEAALLTQAASRAAAAGAATSGIEAIVIGSTLADTGAAGAVLGTGAMAVMPAAAAAVAPVAVGVAEAAAAVAIAPTLPLVLSATLIAGGATMAGISLGHFYQHNKDAMHYAVL